MDAETLAKLLDRYASPLVLYAHQWTSAGEDIVQEAFVRLLQQVPPPRDPVAWLYAVTRNAAISDARSASRRRQREQLVAERRPNWFVHQPGMAIDAALASGALAELPLESREVIVAHLWGGLTFQQIAEITGASSTTAHRRYMAGLDELRKRLSVEAPTTSTAAKRPD